MAFYDEINQIIGSLIEISEKFFSYDERRKQTIADMRGKALEEEIAALEAGLKGSTKNYVIGMRAAVYHMIEAVKAGNHYDVNDSTISNAAALLKNPGMAFDAAEAIIKGFAGNVTALQILEAAAAEEYKPLFNRWVFDNVAALESMNKTIEKLTYEEGQNFPAIVSEIREQLVAFADHQGIDLNTPHMAEQLREMRMRNIARLAGLSWDDVK